MPTFSQDTHIIVSVPPQAFRCCGLQPVYTESNIGEADVVRPDATPRHISVLYRFSAGGRGSYGLLRTKLLDQYSSNPIPGTAGTPCTILMRSIPSFFRMEEDIITLDYCKITTD